MNQLLAEMDGFDAKSKGVVILAATTVLTCLIRLFFRPGRFDRRVIVDRPDLKGRIAILKVHSKDVLMDDTVGFGCDCYGYCRCCWFRPCKYDK